MKRVCIVQARMGSTRLPGKVLMDVAGQPMLGQVLRRLHACNSIDEIVVATSRRSEDDSLAAYVKTQGVGVYRGSDSDVLGRYVGAARATNAEVVVRVTGDCPLIDPTTTDRVVDELADSEGMADYASNVIRRTFPRGLDVEAMYLDTLLRLDRMGRTSAEREHVTTKIRGRDSRLFWVRSVEADNDDSDLRWTVDEERDLAVVRMLFADLDLANRIAPFEEVVALVRRRPDLAEVNAGIKTWEPTLTERGDS